MTKGTSTYKSATTIAAGALVGMTLIALSTVVPGNDPVHAEVSSELVNAMPITHTGKEFTTAEGTQVSILETDLTTGCDDTEQDVSVFHLTARIVGDVKPSDPIFLNGQGRVLDHDPAQCFSDEFLDWDSPTHSTDTAVYGSWKVDGDIDAIVWSGKRIVLN